MKTGALMIASLLLINFAKAQSANKTIYGEIGGPGLCVSANFDTRFTSKPNGLGIRAGIAYVPAIFASGFAIPVGINYLSGKRNHFFEAEAGASYIHLSEIGDDGWFKLDETSLVYGYLYAGYRYKAKRGFTFRAGIMPFVGEGHVYVWPGLSFGYSFH